MSTYKNNSLKKILFTEKKVQNVYQRVNQTVGIKFEKKNFVKITKFLKNLFFNYLIKQIEFLENKVAKNLVVELVSFQ